jgi:hypothetical protein
MEIKKKFNAMTLNEIIAYIESRNKYTNFNTLGLYRSIVENEKLTLSEKLELREYAHALFQKTFDFLQLKDPKTYIDVCTLGEELTKADENQLWQNVVMGRNSWTTKLSCACVRKFSMLRACWGIIICRKNKPFWLQLY